MRCWPKIEVSWVRVWDFGSKRLTYFTFTHLLLVIHSFLSLVYSVRPRDQVILRRYTLHLHPKQWSRAKVHICCLFCVCNLRCPESSIIEYLHVRVDVLFFGHCLCFPVKMTLSIDWIRANSCMHSMPRIDYFQHGIMWLQLICLVLF